MLIKGNNQFEILLPVYEVQEVSIKEALALLKSDQSVAVDPLDNHVDSCIPVSSGGSSELNGMNGSSL